jgi:trehalose 6-phosphate synthase
VAALPLRTRDTHLSRRDFTTYRHVNEKFAAAASEEADGISPVVLVQDYHFALAPRMLRDRLPLSTIVTFWHIPWPTPSRFGTCPWRRNLLCGLLGSAIIGFHTDCDRQQFLHTVERFLDADVDHERGTVTYGGHTTAVRTYPISIEWPSRFTLRSSEGRTCRDSVLRRLSLPADARLVVGVDRLDYTKGICEKVLAIERLFESYPEFRGRVRFVQIAEPSRECLPAYRELRSRVLATIDRVNTRFGSLGYQPIVLRQMHHEPAEVFEFLRSADVCYVGSLHDGMNLVAKEFVAARDDYRGVLVLSVFAGAAQQLSGALMVNPFEIDDASHILAQALRMAASEQATRMRAMRSIVAESNSYWWAGRMLQDAARIRKAQGLFSATRPAVMQKIPA